MSNQIIPCTVAIAIAINIILPMLLKPFATPTEIKPPNGAANLPFKSQLMYMFTHHAQVPVSSSAIVAVIVALSLTICKTMCKNQRL